MAKLLAEMDSAFKFLTAWKTTSNFSEPARLILQSLLATNTWLLNQERAFGT
jgi:hypothetical protein